MKKKKSDVYMEVFCPVAKKPYELVEGKPICPACGERIDISSDRNDQLDMSGHSVRKEALK